MTGMSKIYETVYKYSEKSWIMCGLDFGKFHTDGTIFTHMEQCAILNLK